MGSMQEWVDWELSRGLACFGEQLPFTGGEIKQRTSMKGPSLSRAPWMVLQCVHALVKFEKLSYFTTNG